MAKEAQITKRRQMVPGSEWKFTKDCEINLWVSNPEMGKICKQRDSMYRSSNSEHRQGNSIVITLGAGRGNTAEEKAQMAALTEQIKKMDSKIKVKAASIFAGTTVRVTGKQATSNARQKKYSNGLMFPMKLLENDAEFYLDMAADWTYDNPMTDFGSNWKHRVILLPYNQIEDCVEPTSVPETIVYVLRDNVTNEYFGGWQFEIDKYGHNRSTNTPKMAATFSGSKKYKNLAALKASIMDFTGYRAGLDSESYVEEWLGDGEKKIDLPPNWEAVEIDKTTNAEKSVHDVQKWYADLIRLRKLTASVGSAVRTLYKKIEKKNETAKYPVIVAFDFKDYTPAFSVYRGTDTIPDDQINLIKAAMKHTTGKPLSSKSETVQAYGITNDSDAILIQLAYQGAAKFRAYDTVTLEELVLSEPEKVA